MTAAETLRRVRTVYRERSGNSPGTSRYTVYLATMVILIAVVPLLRALVLGLARRWGQRS